MSLSDLSLANLMTEFSLRFCRPAQGASGLLHFPSTYGVTEKAKLLWVIKLRWIAITLFFVLSGPALILGNLNRNSFPAYVGILGVLLVFNLLSQLIINEHKGAIGEIIICFQLAFDLLVLTGLLAVTGGTANPFMLLFMLNASLGGLLISARLSFPFIILIHGLIAGLQIQSMINNTVFVNITTWTLFCVYHFMVLASWLVMRSLGSYLERQNVRQNQAKIAFEKQDRLRSIGALAAGFSHEFASPLNVAKIRIERLFRQTQSEDAEEALNAIVICENVIHQMNSSQLDLRSFQFKNLYVGELLLDVLESWQEDKPDLQVLTDISPGIEASLPAVNFSQVVINLLDNAFEANPDGKLKVELSTIEEQVCLSISDEGPGFLENVLRQRGEPFVTTKENGTGLGLYVSELFAQSLGGHLRVKNLSPRGALVTICWPLAEVKK